MAASTDASAAAAAGGTRPSLLRFQSADDVFEQLTIPEIRKLDAETASELEGKKQELRRLVGDRYRDLIDSADAILAMNKHCSAVSGLIKRLQTSLETMHLQHDLSPDPVAAEAAASASQSQHEQAMLVRFVVSAPEQLWTAVTAKALLPAVVLFLSAGRVMHLLRSAADDSATSSLASQPIVQRQFATVETFRARLSRAAEQRIGEHAASATDVASALVVLVLLDSLSPDAALLRFLRLRLQALEQMLAVPRGTQDEDGAAAAEQLDAGLRQVARTVEDVDAVFLRAERVGDGGLVSRALAVLCAHPVSRSAGRHRQSLSALLSEQLADTHVETGEYLAAFVQHFALPDALHAARSTLPSAWRTFFDPSSSDLQRRIGEAWLEPAVAAFHAGAAGILAQHQRVAPVVAVHRRLQASSDALRTADFDAASDRVLDAKLDLLDRFVLHPVHARYHDVVRVQLDRVSLQPQLQQVVADLPASEADVAAYVWQADQAAGATAPASPGKLSLEQSVGVADRVTARTLGVARVTDAMLRQLNDLIDDLHVLLSSPACWDVRVTPSVPQRIADLQATLLTSCTAACDRVIDTELLSVLQQVSDSSGDEGNSRVAVAVFVGRLARLLAGPRTPIRQLLHPLQTFDQLRKHAPHQARVRMMARDAETDEFAHVRTQLMQLCDDAFQLWVQQASETAASRLAEGLATSPVAADVTTWAGVQLGDAEDQDAGEHVIQVPQCASARLVDMLYAVCCDIERVGGHTVPAATRRALALALTRRVLPVLATHADQLIATSAAEPVLLQLLFDLHFFLAVTAGRTDPLRQDVVKVLARVEEAIDPINFAIYEPPIKARVAAACQRHAVLLGALLSLSSSRARADESTAAAGAAAASAASSPYILVSLAKPVSRFFAMNPLFQPRQSCCVTGDGERARGRTMQPAAAGTAARAWRSGAFDTAATQCDAMVRIASQDAMQRLAARANACLARWQAGQVSDAAAADVMATMRVEARPCSRVYWAICVNQALMLARSRSKRHARDFLQQCLHQQPEAVAAYVADDPHARPAARLLCWLWLRCSNSSTGASSGNDDDRVRATLLSSLLRFPVIAAATTTTAAAITSGAASAATTVSSDASALVAAVRRQPACTAMLMLALSRLLQSQPIRLDLVREVTDVATCVQSPSSLLVVLLACAHRVLGQASQAASLWTTQLRSSLRPCPGPAMLNLVLIWQEVGQIQAAQEMLCLLLQRFEDAAEDTHDSLPAGLPRSAHAALLALLSGLYTRLLQLGLAQRAAEMALEALDPHDVWHIHLPLRLQRIWLLCRQTGRSAAACDAARDLLLSTHLEPEHDHAAVRQAAALAALVAGRATLALRCLQPRDPGACHADPSMCNDRAVVIWCCRRDGNRVDAMRQWRAALSLPDAEAAVMYNYVLAFLRYASPQSAAGKVIAVTQAYIKGTRRVVAAQAPAPLDLHLVAVPGPIDMLVARELVTWCHASAKLARSASQSA